MCTMRQTSQVSPAVRSAICVAGYWLPPHGLHTLSMPQEVTMRKAIRIALSLHGSPVAIGRHNSTKVDAIRILVDAVGGYVPSHTDLEAGHVELVASKLKCKRAGVVGYVINSNDLDACNQSGDEHGGK